MKNMQNVVRWLKQNKENIHLEWEVRSFCDYLDRILFKERLILLRCQDDETYCQIYSCSFNHFGDGLSKKRFGKIRNSRKHAKDEKIRQLLKKSMNGTVLAVVVSASETGKDYYGFWLAGGGWHVFPGEKLLTKKNFFC